MGKRLGGVAADDFEAAGAFVQHFGGNLHHGGAKALPHIDAGDRQRVAPVGQLCQNAAAVVGIPLAHAHVFKAAGHAHPQSQIGIALLPVRLPVAGDDGLGLLPADSDGLENAHALLNHLGGQRPVAGRERIAQTNFKGVHAQPFGRLVD